MRIESRLTAFGYRTTRVIHTQVGVHCLEKEDQDLEFLTTLSILTSLIASLVGGVLSRPMQRVR